MKRRHGFLFLLSGASCSGKGTLKKRLAKVRTGITVYVTCTTRQPREGEVNGKHYHFYSDAEFDSLKGADFFYEHMTVHGKQYGTPKIEPGKGTILERLQQGEDIVLDIDVQGAKEIRKNPDLAPYLVDIFILYPSIEDLEKRMIERDGKIDPIRLENAPLEQQQHRDFRYKIVNDDLERAMRDLLKIADHYLNN